MAAKDIIRKTQFWDTFRETPINDRQRLLLNRVLDQGSGFEGHISHKRYAKLLEHAKVTVSPITTKRDLADLVHKGLLTPTVATGRNAAYRLSEPKEPR